MIPCPVTPSLVTTSTSTSGDSAITPLAVRCGSGIGTRTARARTSRTMAVAAAAPGDTLDMRLTLPALRPAPSAARVSRSRQQLALAQDGVDFRPPRGLVDDDGRVRGQQRAQGGRIVAARLGAELRAVQQPSAG